MKKFKNLFLVITVCLFFGAGAVSCSSDDNHYSIPYYLYIATLDNTDNHSITLDDSTTLYVTQPTGAYQTKYERAIIDFTVLGKDFNKHDYAVRLNRIYDVLTKNIIYIDSKDEHDMDSIGNEPIIIRRLWEGGGYVNIEFEFQTNGDKAHMLNLVNFQNEIPITATEISLDLRHSLAGASRGGYPTRGYASFRLGDFKNFTSEKITFTINAKNYKGENVIHKLDYKPRTKQLDKKQEALTELSTATNSEYY